MHIEMSSERTLLSNRASAGDDTGVALGNSIGVLVCAELVSGSQFDASKNGIAGHVERAVDGPSNPAGSSK
jgi:hypothetical protein